MSTSPGKQGRHTAGAFDIRNFIGLLLAIYGAILTVYSFLPGGQAPEKTGDINANLLIGVLLLVVGGGFMLWARLRPVIVPEHVEHDSDRPAGH